VLSLLVTGSAFGQPVLTNGLTVYYPFNGNANDASGNGFNGVASSNCWFSADRLGHANYAIFITNNTSETQSGAGRIDIPAAALNSLASGTISAWIMPTAIASGVIIVKQHNGANTYANFTFGGYFNSSSAQYVPGNPGTLYFNPHNYATVASSSSVITAQTWQQVVVTFTSSSCSFYINGIPCGTNAGNFSVPDDSNPDYTTIGCWLGDGFSVPQERYVGALDDVRIYHRALSGAEVQQLYQIESSRPLSPIATGIATETNGFVIGVTVTYGGYGYTNTPQVQFIGGGGSGAQAIAVVSNGVVTAIQVLTAGSGYTNAPLVLIGPPFIPNPVLGIGRMSFLSFSNLTIGGSYQLQQSVQYYWTNQSVSFTASNTLFTQMVAGAVTSGNYRLALNPVPAQAFATPQVVDGFVVAATLTSGGSGYVTSPTVTIVGRSINGAGAYSSISGGVVTGITVTNAGYGYTNTVTIQIAPPPAAAVFPTVQPVMRVDSANLAPYDNYQIQFKPDITVPWMNWNGGLFTPTGITNSQFIFITNGVGYFRLQYVP
jgi:hypothetical protein